VRGSTSGVRPGSVVGVEGPALLQTGPETFRVLFGDGITVEARLSHEARRELGMTGVPPLTVATEIVRFLVEQGALPPEGAGAQPAGELPLVGAGARHPGFIEELRSRLS
jgi:hypothetical protein